MAGSGDGAELWAFQWGVVYPNVAETFDIKVDSQYLRNIHASLDFSQGHGVLSVDRYPALDSDNAYCGCRLALAVPVPSQLQNLLHDLGADERAARQALDQAVERARRETGNAFKLKYLGQRATDGTYVVNSAEWVSPSYHGRSFKNAVKLEGECSLKLGDATVCEISSIKVGRLNHLSLPKSMANRCTLELQLAKVCKASATSKISGTPMGDLRMSLVCEGALGIPIQDTAVKQFHENCLRLGKYDLDVGKGLFKMSLWEWPQTTNVQIWLLWKGHLQIQSEDPKEQFYHATSTEWLNNAIAKGTFTTPTELKWMLDSAMAEDLMREWHKPL